MNPKDTTIIQTEPIPLTDNRQYKSNLNHPWRQPLSLTDDRQRFRLQEILVATNDFSDENLITEGALGKVYKGKLFWNENWKNFMVRKLDCRYGQGDELQTEFSMVKSLKHKNIISILGYNDESNEKIIVYEQAVHGTLDQHLTDPSLTWLQRLKICLGVARALSYIHYDIIHCDINSSKIFLDEDWEPKIYGFELSTKYPQSWKHRLLYSHYFNTDNYMTPEYDVYSFGVLLLEVLCGRKPMITNDVIKEVIDEFIDPHLRKQANAQSLALFKHITDNCLNRQLVHRPTMDKIVKELEDVLELQQNSIAPHEDTTFNNLKVDFLKIPLIEIKRATNYFHDDYSIGSGGYGTVYKAELDVLDIQSLSSMEGKCKDELPKINKVVAIKRILRREDEQDKQGFLSEIKLLTSCKHPNIVSLLGFSREDDEMILVYEYAFKGSLSDYLRNNNLTWVQRIQICLEIAHAINYIHTDMEGKPRIIHRDIKSDNILLDANLHAKVADFGLSTFHPLMQQASTIYTQNIAGTMVYMDPEYLETGKYKRESDIYSFGVVLFEVLSGSMAYDAIYIAKNETGLAHIARRRFNEGTLKELMDPKMIKEDVDCNFTLNRGPNQTSFNTFSEVAYRCLAETQARRPTMKVVIKELQKALELQGETMVLSKFQLSDIELATENFAATYCIGLDTERKVYKAELDHFGNSISSSTEGMNNGEPSKKRITVAIKCIINSESGRGKQAFFEELEKRTSYKHPNIVSLIGFCYEVDKMILVYEHASKSSLDDYLKSVDGMKNYTWTQRLHMCLEIARGLNHLHTSPQRIIHGDIKSATILLGMNHEAKIAYYGISKHRTNQEVGMEVYADPEYETTGKLERHSDVYSFGVVLFEIFCGRVAYSPVYMKDNEKGLAPIARMCVNDGSIERIIDPKLIEETDDDILTSNRRPNNDSLNRFLKVACQCLGEAANRATMQMVINELEIALNFHDSEDYKEIIQMSKNPEIYSTTNRKDIYDILSKGILIQEDKVWFSLGSKGERNEMVSASQFSFENRWSHKWHSLPESRFDKVAELLNISNLNMQIQISSRSLSLGIKYGVHLVFKFHGARKNVANRMYVNLTYKMGNETLHAYFATWREDEWMSIELYRFLNHKESDTDFEFLIKSFSRCYCGNRAIYVEGIELRAIDNEENILTEVPQVPQSTLHMNQMQQLPINDYPLDICSIFTQTLLKLFRWRNEGKQYYMLSANEAFCHSFNAKRFHWKSTTKSRFQKVAELLSTQEFLIKCKIESRMLLQDTEYSCYLVFKLSEKCSGLHCPVMVRDLHQQKNKQMVRDLHQQKNKQSEVVYFRSPKPWNIGRVPQEREDGWMEVCVWKFKSNNELQNDRNSINLEFENYEGMMSGLIVCGLEFRLM
ncbi:uncharacterized protein LOC110908699 isoform X3 [Helianthus annuus]|uniref:uncharacterized protein LOC110908699 isoform X3 n=1 Tax=Helianthus annuus TaxID=4232 RepID=UPI000B9088BA|nr:uncharacterized protein LOC110908699 isoform X3 [Helianthus annuus]